jgi:hypothetical protein
MRASSLFTSPADALNAPAVTRSAATIADRAAKRGKFIVALPHDSHAPVKFAGL